MIRHGTLIHDHGNAGANQVCPLFHENGKCWGAPGPFGIATMPLDAALDYIASEPHFRINP